MLAWMLVLAFHAVPTESASPAIKLDVLVLNDSDFPPITEASALSMLGQAERTLEDKLGDSTLRFRLVGIEELAPFIARGVSQSESCMDELGLFQVVPGKRTAASIPQERVISFLKRWPLDALRAFFPKDTKVDTGSYDSVAAALAREFDRKVSLIEGFKTPNGSSLLQADKLASRSYVNWVCALRVQDAADVILTNGFVIYDLGSEPYPHSIFQKGKVGGASLKSATRTALRDRVLFASTFSMHTEIPFFAEEGAAALTAIEREQVIGTFILAHELGHAVYKIPDFYDHPPECLMTTKFETGYVSGFEALAAHPGPCSRCSPYIDARRFYFVGRQAYANGQFRSAIDAFRQAIKTTPKHIDGDYRTYLANISVDVGRSYLGLKEHAKARSWARSALKIVPDHPTASELVSQIPTQASK